MLRPVCLATVLFMVAVVTMRAEACVYRREPNMAYIQNAESTVPPEARELFKTAQAAEGRDIRAALELYALAAKAGDGRAALRLGEIYYRGVEGVPRDYAETVKWDNQARMLGALKPLNC
jgi:TPR repeat protein